jgi:hypothetical protein
MTPPVLLIVFNRPDLTELALEAIRAARPRVLFVAADGPREGNERDAELCAATRRVIEKVDWPCELVRNFADHNLGCGRRPATAISWALGFTEHLMIMEDDCVPHPSSFRYCAELLERYADDARVMHIGCTNFRHRDPRAQYSYRFSKYPHGVCWATWKRAWNLYDYDMIGWPSYKTSRAFGEHCRDAIEKAYWTYYWDRAFTSAEKHYWDYQWTFACWLHGGLAISPSVNLVSNIGFRPDGTHTTTDDQWANMPTFDIGELIHPLRVEADQRADWWEFVHHYGGEWYRQERRARNPLRRVCRFVARRIGVGRKTA